MKHMTGFVDKPSRMLTYDAIVREMKDQFHLRVRRWRNQMSGCAWRVRYDDGRVINWIEAPRPRTPISLAIFLHEVGHHVVGFDRYVVPSEEEYHVWLWALGKMEEVGVPPDEGVFRRFERSMQYAVQKDLRRGEHELPASLKRFS